MPFIPRGAELIVILIVILVLFGPKRLPQMGKAIGETFKELRSSISGKSEEEDKVQAEEKPEPVTAKHSEDTSA